MPIVDLRPADLSELADQLHSGFKRFRAQGIHVRLESDSVRIDGKVGQQGWNLEWKEPAYTWSKANSRIRLDLACFHGLFELHQEFYTLLITRMKPAEISTENLVERLLSPGSGKRLDAVQEVFFRRALNAIAHLKQLSDHELTAAISAPSDKGVIVRALQSPEALAPEKAVDPLLGARLRGVGSKQRLIESHGGAIGAEDAARLLGITRQAVDKRRRKGQLLAVELGGRGYHYPAWQFGDSGTLPGLDKVLESLADHDPWMQVAFFVAPNPRLGGIAPVQALAEKRVEKVLIAARAFGEQGSE